MKEIRKKYQKQELEKNIKSYMVQVGVTPKYAYVSVFLRKITNKLKGTSLKWNLESRPPPARRFPESPPGNIAPPPEATSRTLWKVKVCHIVLATLT